jgi:hypothetical protein
MGDSTKETKDHIRRVHDLLFSAGYDLQKRGRNHDASKLEEPEKSLFDAEAGTIDTLEYGTPEYKASCDRLKPALEHHYANNSHHPQYYEDGVNGMNLFDIVEMFFDWKASGERTKGGNIYKSIDINAERHGVSKQMRKILINTANYLGYEHSKTDS